MKWLRPFIRTRPQNTKHGIAASREARAAVAELVNRAQQTPERFEDDRATLRDLRTALRPLRACSGARAGGLAVPEIRPRRSAPV